MEIAQRDNPGIQPKYTGILIDVKRRMDFWINQNQYPVLRIKKKNALTQTNIKNYTSLFKSLIVPVTGTTQKHLNFDVDTHEHYMNWLVDGQMLDHYLYSDNGWVIINLQQIGK